ncbi:MAG: S41 family peptidase [Clostridia bacterium]|nr:S41 family peptidase [Clostridia bacterium]
MEYNNENLQKLQEQLAQIEAAKAKKKNRRTILVFATVVVLACSLTWFFTDAYYRAQKAQDINYGSLGEVITDEVALKKFVDQFQMLKNYYYFGATDEQLMQGAMYGMAAYLGDPYTTYFSKEENEEFYGQMEGSYVGIGVSVSMSEDKIVTILQVFDDSPAAKAGVCKGDKIIKVEGQDVTNAPDTNAVVNLIKGDEGTSVNVTFYRPSTGETLSKDIVRAKITNYTVTYEMKEDGVGYIAINSFDATVDQQFEKAMDALIKQGAKGIIIDLRDNGGGYLQQSLNMANMFVEKGKLLLTLKFADTDGTGNSKENYNSWSKTKYEDVEIVILINEYSASASEVFTGIMKDYKLATIVGTTTFGKGIVQSMHVFDDGSALKFTTSSYFTPGGYEIHGNGIAPDVDEPIDPKYELYSPAVIPEGCDNQLNKALEVIKGMINE